MGRDGGRGPGRRPDPGASRRGGRGHGRGKGGTAMRFTVKERERRFQAVRSRMQAAGLDALFVFGSTSVGGQWNGNFTYLSDYSPIFATALLVFPLEGSPAMFVPGENQWLDAKRASWIEDTRLSGRPIADACRHL